MQGDFSRDSFDPLQRFTRVLQQQGRVTLDADTNEMQSIQLALLRGALVDLIGDAGTPDAFRIGPASDGNFEIGAGHYYVGGRMCDNPEPSSYAAGDGRSQPWLPTPPEPLPALAPLATDTATLVYLDVWERHVSVNQADGLREVALGGLDTASRAQLVWQVKLTTAPAPAKARFAAADADAFVAAALAALRTASGRLIAKAADPTAADDSAPCLVSPQARYRGLENQLYRVEIHRGGTAAAVGTEPKPKRRAKGDAAPLADADEGGPTFVWSRENASVTFAVADIAGPRVRLRDGWHDARFGLSVGDWVEIVDDVSDLSGRADDLRQVKAWDGDEQVVTLDATPFITTDDAARHVILRLWNHAARVGNPAAPVLADDNALRLVEGRPLPLEDGITIEFAPAADGTRGRYRTGDYWLIPARAAIADIVWPRDPTGAALPLPPHGIDHGYAPLALFGINGDNPVDLRKTITKVSS